MLNRTPSPTPTIAGPARVAPHSIDAEQALLGALLLNNDALAVIGEIVEPRHFFDPLHGRIFEATRELVSSGRLAAPHSLRQFFEGEPEIAPGVPVWTYLARLVTASTSVLNAKDYAKHVREMADRRDLIALGEGMVEAAYTSELGTSSDVLIEEAEQQLFEMSRKGGIASREVSAGGAFTGMIEQMAWAFQEGTGLVGRSTGFPSLDKRLGGLAKGDLIVLAGRPSMGKSALAANIATNLAEQLRADGEGGEVLFASLEMSAEQLMQRYVADKTGIPSEALRTGSFTEAEFRRVAEMAKDIAALPFHIDTTGAISIGQLTARARRRKRLHNTQLIVVDYLQLMVSGGRTGNRVEEITRITTGLKAMAKELEVPVIALSQLSREVEKREDKRPQLSDLRESGSIEQDADIVLFVYRDEYYLLRSEPPIQNAADHAEWETKLQAAEGWADVIIGKHRHGPVGSLEMGFEGAFTKFYERRESDPLRRRASARASELAAARALNQRGEALL